MQRIRISQSIRAVKSASPNEASADSPAAGSGLPAELASGLAQREIPILNGMRAIAVLLVVLYHAGLAAPGGFGVLIFFTLSGFLITWLLLAEFRKTGSISLRKFFIRRSLRIFPAFYAYWFILLALLLAFHKRVVVGQFLASFFYVNDYYQAIFGDPGSGVSHTWSLAVEEQFYLIWAPAAVFLLRRRWMFPALVYAIPILWTYRLVLVMFHVHQGYIYEAFDTRAPDLLVGCLLAWLLFNEKWTRLFHLVCRPSAMLSIAAVLLILIAAESRFGPTFRDTVSFTAEPVLVAALIAGLIDARSTLAGRILDAPLVASLGRISYSVYLYQQPLVAPLDKLLDSAPLAIRALLIVAGVSAAALLSYYVIERPFLKLKHRFQVVDKGV